MKRHACIFFLLAAVLPWAAGCTAVKTAASTPSGAALSGTPVETTTVTPTPGVPAPYEDVALDRERDLSPQVADSDLADLVLGNTGFAFDLYQEIAAGEDNLFFSPYSISLAMAMTYAGARGRTAEQMAQTLHFFLAPQTLHPAFNKLALELDSRSTGEKIDPEKAFRLSVVNSFWGQSGTLFEGEFLDTLATHYDSSVHLVDYQKDPEGARLAINAWVGRSTRQKIQDLIPPGTLHALTRLVLANAVYFKAAWEHPFAPKLTQDGNFRLLNGRIVRTPMMAAVLDMKGMQGDGYWAVDLPYAGGQLSMMIVLPEAGRFHEVEEKLDPEFIQKAYAAMQINEFIAFCMPKFSFEWSTELSDGLNALGMRDALDPSAADFSGMDGTRTLHLSQILQKAFISVDENGTEAGASTAVIGTMGIPQEFSLDRPFLFLIRDNPTGTILFLGRVMNPAA